MTRSFRVYSPQQILYGRSKKMRSEGYIACISQMKNIYMVFMVEPERKRAFGRSTSKWKVASGEGGSIWNLNSSMLTNQASINTLFNIYVRIATSIMFGVGVREGTEKSVTSQSGNVRHYKRKIKTLS